MKLIKSKRGKFFLACAGYPACRKTLPIDIDMIEEYFYRNNSDYLQKARKYGHFTGYKN